MKKDFCYCKGKRCALRMRCARFLDGLRAMLEDGHLWIDECGYDRDLYIETEPRF